MKIILFLIIFDYLSFNLLAEEIVSDASSVESSSVNQCQEFAKQRPDLKDDLMLESSSENLSTSLRERAANCAKGLLSAWKDTIHALIIDPYVFMMHTSPAQTKAFLDNCNKSIICKNQLFYEAYGRTPSTTEDKKLSSSMTFADLDILYRNAKSRMNSTGEQNRRLRSELLNRKFLADGVVSNEVFDVSQEKPSIWAMLKNIMSSEKQKWSCLKPQAAQELFCYYLAQVIDPTIALGVVSKLPKLSKLKNFIEDTRTTSALASDKSAKAVPSTPALASDKSAKAVPSTPALASDKSVKAVPSTPALASDESVKAVPPTSAYTSGLSSPQTWQQAENIIDTSVKNLFGKNQLDSIFTLERIDLEKIKINPTTDIKEFNAKMLSTVKDLEKIIKTTTDPKIKSAATKTLVKYAKAGSIDFRSGLLSLKNELLARLKVNNTEVLAEPIPFDTQFDVYAITKTSNGQFYHIKPSALAADVKDIEGAAFVPQNTYFPNAEGFFEFMGFKERCHPTVGCYFSTYPSAAEFMARKEKWNALAIKEGHPERVVEMNYLEGGVAPMQRRMAENMSKNKATHIQDPTKVYTERYAPIGGGQHEEGVFSQLVVDPTTQKVAIKGGLGRHDLFEMLNSIAVPAKTLARYSIQADAHLKVLNILKGTQIKVRGLDVESFKETFKGFVNTKLGKQEVVKVDTPGLSAERYQEFLLHNAMAAQHTDFHLGHWLARNPEGIDPNKIPEFGWGNVFQKEIQMHLARVGTRATDSKPPFAAPMVVENFKLAKDSGKVLTLESMLKHTLNEGNSAFIKGFNRIYTATQKQAKSAIATVADEAKTVLKQMDALRASHPIFKFKSLTAAELRLLANKYREKIESISAYKNSTSKKNATELADKPASSFDTMESISTIDAPITSAASLRSMQSQVDTIIGKLIEDPNLSPLRREQLLRAQAVLDFPGASYENLPISLKKDIYRLAFTARQESLALTPNTTAMKAEALINDFENIAQTENGMPLNFNGNTKLRSALMSAINEVEKTSVSIFSKEAAAAAKYRETAFINGFLKVSGNTPEMKDLAQKFNSICQAGALCGKINSTVVAQADNIEIKSITGSSIEKPETDIAIKSDAPTVLPPIRGITYGPNNFGKKLDMLDDAIAKGMPSSKLLKEALAARPTLSDHLGKIAAGNIELEVLPVPLLQDSMTEIWAKSYPRGKENGALFHIRIREDAKAVMAQNPEAFTTQGGWTPLGTRFNSKNKGFFSFLHSSEGSHPLAGKFYATRPSPQLFNTLATEFNTLALNKPDSKIYLRGIVSGADNQWEMAKYYSEYNAIGFPDPARNTPYAPTGLASKGTSLATPIQVEVTNNGKKRVKGYDKGLEFHDGDEFLSAVTISERLATARKIDDTHMYGAWKEVRKKEGKNYENATPVSFVNPRTGKIDTAYQEEMMSWAQKIYDGAVVAEKTNPESWSAKAKRGMFVDKNGKVTGLSESRLLELEMYILERRWHSGFHIHGYLAENPTGITAYQSVTEYGPMYQKENVLHMAGLGAKTVAEKPPAVSPLIQKTVSDATDLTGLDLTKARNSLYNTSRARILRLSHYLTNSNARMIFENYFKQRPKYTPAQIRAFAKEDLNIHRTIIQTGNSFNPK